jgi:RNA polymerase sigma-70 factor, ECF subfamily
MGLQHADAADLVQEVFVVVFQKIPEFQHGAGRSFRGWLWKITRNKCLERARGRRPSIVPSSTLDKFADEAGDAMCEEEFRRHVIGRVVPMLQAEFPASVWGPFWAHVVEGKPASQVAADLGINIWAVYTAKIRVITHLNKELGDLVTN